MRKILCILIMVFSGYKFYICFSYVMDGDLANCTIITYDSFDGSHDGIIVDVENRRIIEFVYSVW